MLKNVRLLREERKISQQKLADVIGVSQQSVNGYENQDHQPDIATLIKMADYFETSIDYIVGHTSLRNRIEIVENYALNEQEAALMDRYRSLPASSRKVIGDLMADMLKK